MNTLSENFWQNESRILLAVIKPKLQAIYLAGALLSSADIGVTLSWEKANESAIRWANEHTDTLLSQLMETTIEGVGQIIADWIASPTQDMGDLHSSLLKLFDRDRASRIAVTETTRAFASAAQEQFTSNGVEYWRWNTNRDEMVIEGKRRGVCEICAPLDGKIVRIGEPFGYNKKGEPIIKPPDAHVGDRCWVTPVVNLTKHLPRTNDSHFRKHLGPGNHPNGTPQSIHGKWKSLGRTTASFGDFLKPTEVFEVFDNAGAILDLGTDSTFMVDLRGKKRIIASAGYMLHSKLVEKVDPNDTVDSWIRFYVTDDGIKVSTLYAAVDVMGDPDREKANERAYRNIYSALDLLKKRGMPAGTRVFIDDPISESQVETTL
jgi:hypothetical protein